MNINHVVIGSAMFVSGAVAQDMAIQCDAKTCVMSKETLGEIATQMQLLLNEIDLLKARSGCS